MRNMYGLEGSDRLLIDGNATETATMAGSATAPSAPIAQSPTEDVSPVAPPASASTVEELSPVSAPASAPTMKGLSPVFESPVSAPATFPSRVADPTFPTPFDGSTTPLTPSSSSMSEDIESWLLNPFHLIVIACIVGVVALLLFWKCCKSWKLKREKQMLRLQSTRVDAVLGDMQMVGMDDYDSDDPELI